MFNTIMDVSKVVSDYESDYKKLQAALDALKKPTIPELDKIRSQAGALEDKVRKLQQDLARPIKGVIRDLADHIRSIEVAMGQIEEGRDATESVKEHIGHISDIFKRFIDYKNDIKALLGDIDSIHSDIAYARNRIRTAGIIQSIMLR